MASTWPTSLTTSSSSSSSSLHLSPAQLCSARNKYLTLKSARHSCFYNYSSRCSEPWRQRGKSRVSTLTTAPESSMEAAGASSTTRLASVCRRRTRRPRCSSSPCSTPRWCSTRVFYFSLTWPWKSFSPTAQPNSPLRGSTVHKHGLFIIWIHSSYSFCVLN